MNGGIPPETRKEGRRVGGERDRELGVRADDEMD
jgi:hypothetical protein